MLGVESAHIKPCEIPAAREHVAHIRNVVRLEVGYVQRSQSATVTEHFAHICYVVRLQEFNVCNGSQV